ncbi:hypothetical protein TFLX_05370 [Thermoflexales bacterium]|nr:hypothetical protein TFLX_05370 [Thermoflexales bacterium]
MDVSSIPEVDILMLSAKKLYWLEYCNAGPLYLNKAFAAVGFQTEVNDWGPQVPRGLRDRCLPDLEKFQPDIIALWVGLGGNALKALKNVPPEWMEVHGLIRQNPQLKHCKIMTFMRESAASQVREDEWKRTCDLYLVQPFRWIEHAKLAKRWVGEEPSDVAGVNYYLSENGTWNIARLDAKHPSTQLPDAAGQFDRVPMTRLLTAYEVDGPRWIRGGILPKRATYIVYVVKDLPSWTVGLDPSEREWLKALSRQAPPDSQLLLGANDQILRTDRDSINRVIEQAQHSGGWQIFISEHMWFENVGIADFEKAVYESSQDSPRVWNSIAM